MRVRLIGHYTDPYTWELVRINKVISIRSVEAAKIWAKQTYWKCRINIAEQEKDIGDNT